MRAALLLLFVCALPGATAALETREIPEVAEGPAGLAADSEGRLWIPMVETLGVLRFDPARSEWVFARIPGGATDGADSPFDIAVGADGAVWTANRTHLIRIHANLTAQAFALPNATERGGEIQPDPSGVVWYALPPLERLARLTLATGRFAEFAFPDPPFGPSGLALVGADLYVAGSTAGSYARRAGESFDRGDAAILENPLGLEADSEALWATEAGRASLARVDLRGDGVRRFPLLGTASPLRPVLVEPGAQGLLGVVVPSEGWIARIDPAAGTFDATRLEGASDLRGVAVTGDGSVWAVDAATGTLVRMPPGPSAPAFEAPSEVRVARGKSASLLAPAPAGFLWAPESAGLRVEARGAGLVVVAASDLALGEHWLLVAAPEGNGSEVAGRFVSVVVVAKGIPGPEAAFLLAALGLLAFRDWRLQHTSKL